MTDTDDPLAIIARYQVVPPVNVEAIAESLGLAVYRQILGDNIAAMILRDRLRGGQSGFAVFINTNDMKVRQRFSLAHEIAHYVLHRDLIENGVTDDTMYRSSELSSHYETQANKFAADILMPIRLIKKSYQANQSYQPNPSLSGLASLFQVSKASMKIRLDGLNYEYSS